MAAVSSSSTGQSSYRPAPSRRQTLTAHTVQLHRSNGNGSQPRTHWLPPLPLPLRVMCSRAQIFCSLVLLAHPSLAGIVVALVCSGSSSLLVGVYDSRRDRGVVQSKAACPSVSCPANRGGVFGSQPTAYKILLAAALLPPKTRVELPRPRGSYSRLLSSSIHASPSFK